MFVCIRRLTPDKHKVLPTYEELTVRLPPWQDRHTRASDFRQSNGVRLLGKLKTFFMKFLSVMKNYSITHTTLYLYR